VSKVLKTVAIVAAVVAISFAIPGVGTAIGSAFGVAISAGTAATIAGVASAISALSTAGAGALQKPPDMKGTVNEVMIGANMPIPYVMGRTFVGGMKVYDNSAPGPGGSPNKDRTQIFVGTHAGPIDSFEKFQADFTPITFASESGGLISGVAAGYYGADGGYLWLNSRKGTRPDTALTAPAGRAAITGWTSAHKLSGMACWSATMEFDEEGQRWASGIPAFGMVGKWVKIYDPRKDSTYPGGSGSHRWTDESTWEWSENPGLHALTYARGRYMGSGVKVVGAGIPIDAIDIPAFVELANVCDANGWKCGGAIYEGPGFSRWDNLKRILQAGAAEPAWVGGQLTCRIASPKVALTTITIADLAEGDVEVQAMQPFKDRFNTIVPRYRSEAHRWDYVQADAVTNSTYVTEDGETKTDEVQFDLCQNVNQAAQLAAYTLVNRREFGPIKLRAKARMMGFRPGEAVTVNIPEAGLTNQLAVITARSVDPATGTVDLTLVSETTSKHAFALGKTGVAPPTPTITAPSVVDAAVGGFNSDVTGSQAAVGDGNRQRYSRFEAGTTGWAVINNPSSLPSSLIQLVDAPTAKPFISAAGTFTAPGQQISIGGVGNTAHEFLTPVNQNERIFAGAALGLAIPAGGSWILSVWFANAAGTILGSQSLGTGTAAIAFPEVHGGFADVPPTATGAWLEFYALSGTGTGAFSLVLTEPIITSAGATQTTFPAFSPGPSSELGATIDANIVAPDPIIILASAAGVPKAGQINKVVAVKLMRLGTALGSGVVWGATSISGNAAFTISGTGTGTLTITGPNDATLAKESQIRLTATYQGVTRSLDVKVLRQDDPPTNAGSTGGGGGNPGTTGNTTSFDLVTATTYGSASSAIVTAKAGTAGRVDCSFPGAFTRNPGTTNGQTSLSATVQWRVPAGTFADLPAGSQNSSLNAKTLTPAGDPPDNQDGSISVSDALTGKTPGDTFEFKLTFKKTNVSGTTNDVLPSGVFQCVGS
jgi:hypothetical protein